MDLPMYFWLFSMYFINVLSKVKFYQYSFFKDDLLKPFWCLVRQRNPKARPSGFKSQKHRKKPTTVTRQLKNVKTFAKIVSVTSISGF